MLSGSVPRNGGRPDGGGYHQYPARCGGPPAVPGHGPRQHPAPGDLRAPGRVLFGRPPPGRREPVPAHAISAGRHTLSRGRRESQGRLLWDRDALPAPRQRAFQQSQHSLDREPGVLTVSHARTKSLLIVVGVIAAAAPVPAARAQDAPLRGFDAYVEQALRDWRVPGVAVAVVRNDSVVFSKGYGVRELGKPARVDTHTLFAIGSTTKAFTAAALALLVDSGKLACAEPVTKHLPWLELADPYVTRELTVRDLLTHRSGLPRGDLVWYGSSFDRSEVLHRVRYCKQRWRC